MRDNAAWTEQHFVFGDNYGTFRLMPNPDAPSDTFKDGAMLDYRDGHDGEWQTVAYISAEVLPVMAKALLMASFIAEGPET